MVIIVLVTVLVWAVVDQLSGSEIGYDKSTYNLQEWLINYAGGFVRRGLVGQAVWQLASVFGVGPDVQVLSISLVAFLALTSVLMVASSRLVCVPFLLSSFVLAGPVLDGDIVRKDIFGMLFLAVALLCLKGDLLRRQCRKSRVVIVNAMSIFSLLDHEAYGFYALPVIILENIAYRGWAAPGSRGRAWFAFSVAQYAPSLAVFLLVMVFRGNQQVADRIHQSWVALKGDFIDPQALHGAAAISDSAIGAIGWSTDGFFEQTMDILGSFSGPVWVPLAWLVTMAAGVVLFKHFLDPPAVSATVRDKEFQDYSLLILGLQLVAVLPLFVIAKDYGRWIYIWMTTSILILTVDPSHLRWFLLDPAGPLASRLSLWIPSIPRQVALLALLFIGIPECDWSLADFVGYMPIHSFVEILGRLPGLVFKG